MMGNASDEQVERKLRRVFLSSCLLSVLIVLHLILSSKPDGSPAQLLRVSLLPTLLWSLTVTGYVFYMLWGIAIHRRLKLKELAQRDSLTGAFTDDYMCKRLEQERQRAFESGKATAVAYIRVSGLEKVNDTYGHSVGNIVLRELVRIMLAYIPPDNVVARLGGQEFAALMPETTLQAAQAVLEDVRRAIREYHLDLEERGSIGGLDVSIGIAAYPCNGESAEEIIRAAQRKAMQKR